MFSLLLTGTGLAAGAGLNAYLPLLVLALADRTTNVVNLTTPYSGLSSNTGLLVILVLLLLELIPDKIANIDHMSDLVHSAIRPGAGALAFMSVAHQDADFLLVWALLLGLIIAGGVHWVKMTARPAISKATRGIGNPIVSLMEDALCLLFAILALFLPLGVWIVVPVGLWYLWRMYARMKSGQSRIISPFQPVIEASHSGKDS